MRRFLIAVAFAIAGIYLMLPLGPANVMQARSQPVQAASASQVVGIVQYLIVGDLVKAEEFYHRQLGLESGGGSDPRTRLAWYAMPPGFLPDLFNLNGNVRNINLRIPGTNMGLEPAEFAEAKGKPFQPRFQDPGAARIVFTVRDIDSLMTYFAKAGARVATAGGKPVTVTRSTDRARIAILQDLNGFFVELAQPDPLPAEGGFGGGPGAPPGNNILGAELIGVTVEDTDRAVRFYRDTLGLQVQVGEFMSDRAQLDIFGTRGAQYRSSTVMLPAPSAKIQLVEFKGIDRRPLRLTNQHDPNAMLLRTQVRGLAASLPKLKADQVSILSKGSGGTEFVQMEGRGGAPPIRWLLIRDRTTSCFS